MLYYGAWRPDVGGPASGYARVADGVLPQKVAGGAIGYGPVPQLVTQTGAAALSGAPRGVISLQIPGGAWKVFAATSTTIEELQSDYSWSSVETGRTVPTGDNVSFCHFGSFLLNTDTTDGYKAYNIVTPAGNNAVSGAPSARKIFSADNYVIALDCNGNNQRMMTSDLGRYDVWTGGAADGKIYEDGGALTAGIDVGSHRALVMQESAIRLLEFGSGPSTYSITKLSGTRGCLSDASLVGADGLAFWWDTTGPWMFSSNGIEPIGQDKVNRWCEENIGASNYASLQGMLDPSRNVVAWRIDASRFIVYNWTNREFSTFRANTSTLAYLATAAVTLGDLTDAISAYTIPFGSRAFQGSAPVFGALDSANKFATFSGANMAVQIETDVLDSPTQDLITDAMPIDDCSAGTLTLGTASSPDQSLTWGTPAARETRRSGTTMQRGRGSQIGFRRLIPAGSQWASITGVDHINGAGK